MVKVSVLIPCYNAARYVSQAIDSILAQSFADFELVIVDDGSKDASIEAITRYTDTRIRLVRHGINKGVAEARNTAMKHAKGAYLAFLDADDTSSPDRLEKQVRFLDEHADVDVVGSFGRTMGKLKVWKCPLSHGEILGASFFKFPIWTSVLMFRKNILDRIPIRIDPSFLTAEDQDFIDQLLGGGCILANIPRVLFDRRLHDSNTSLKFSDLADKLTTIIRKRAVLRWLPNCSEQELELHCEIARRSLALSSKDAPAVASWLYTLHTQAVERAVPQPDKFLRAMAAQWDHVCARFVSEGFGIAAKTYFSQPKLVKAAGLSGQAAFLARCFKLKRKLKKSALGNHAPG